MMPVQILPQPTSLGAEVGGALGQGIQRGAEQGFQRGQTQQALSQLGNLPPNASAFDLAKTLISATAGIPGAEKYIGQLFPLLLTQMQAKNLPEGAAKPEGIGGEGYLSAAPLTQQQKLDFAQNLTKQGIPLPQGIESANIISQGSEKSLGHIKSQLETQGVTPQEMPYAIQIAQMNKSNDPNQVVKETRKALDEIRQLDNVLLPGPLRSAAQKGLLGPEAAMLTGRDSRDKALKRLDPIIKKLSDKGYDPIIREKLAGSLGLSPTEIQERLFSANHESEAKEFDKSIGSFPSSGSKEGKDLNILADFIKKNTERGVPLLVQRYKLWNDKGYDWRDVNQAFQVAQEKGLKTSPEQDLELAEFSSVPPRQSMGDIFSDYGRIFDFFLGKK